MKTISLEKRNRIIELHGQGLTNVAIASQLGEYSLSWSKFKLIRICSIGIDRATVSRYKRQYVSVGHVDVQKSAGRKRKLTEQAEGRLVELASEWRFDTNNDLALLLESEGFPKVSDNTITNALKRHGIRNRIAAEKPILDERAKRMRV